MGSTAVKRDGTEDGSLPLDHDRVSLVSCAILRSAAPQYLSNATSGVGATKGHSRCVVCLHNAIQQSLG